MEILARFQRLDWAWPNDLLWENMESLPAQYVTGSTSLEREQEWLNGLDPRLALVYVGRSAALVVLWDYLKPHQSEILSLLTRATLQRREPKEEKKVIISIIPKIFQSLIQRGKFSSLRMSIWYVSRTQKGSLFSLETHNNLPSRHPTG